MIHSKLMLISYFVLYGLIQQNDHMQSGSEAFLDF